MNQNTEKKVRSKAGPKPDTVKIDQPWEEAINNALKKKRPIKGWPKKSNKK